MSLDGFSGELRHGGTSSLGLVTESGIEIVRELDRGPLYVCQHTPTSVPRGAVQHWPVPVSPAWWQRCRFYM
jgi:hypothetical protein